MHEIEKTNQSKETSKLSAMKYIKNNKPRVSVLIISLTLCLVMFYVSAFFLSTTSETFKSLLQETPKKVQFIRMSSASLDCEYNDIVQYRRDMQEKNMELAEKIKKEAGVKEAWYVQVNYMLINSVVGNYYYEMPMLESENVDEYMEHFNAKLIEGKKPENNNEIIIDEKTMKNGSYKIGDGTRDYPDLKIVGIVSCDYYFACGVIDDEAEFDNEQICIISDGSIEDFASLVRGYGYEFNDSDTYIFDLERGKLDYKVNIVDAMSTSSNIIFGMAVSILSILLLIVYISYLRDRRNEWCLYCSIGFSRKEIYASVLRELSFTFLSAIILGGVIISASVIGLDYTYIHELGLKCKYFFPDVIMEILCALVLIFGILQIPIRYAIYKIRTIDALDDDLL